MQSACSGGTGTFIEKTARKLQISPERLAQMTYRGQSLHKISSKCGIFAEADANTLVKGGVPVEEIIASLFEAVVHQNLATLTKGNTPAPKVLLLGGPNLFFSGSAAGLAPSPRATLDRAQGADAARLRPASPRSSVPAEALYYASLGCVEIGKPEQAESARYQGTEQAALVDRGQGQHEQKATRRAAGPGRRCGGARRRFCKLRRPKRQLCHAGRGCDAAGRTNRC